MAAEPLRIHWLVFQNRVIDIILFLAREGRATQQHLVHQNTKGPPVYSTVVWLFLQNLGRHKLGRAANSPSGRAEGHVFFAQTIIGDLDVTIRCQQNVIQFEITMGKIQQIINKWATIVACD